MCCISVYIYTVLANPTHVHVFARTCTPLLVRGLPSHTTNKRHKHTSACVVLYVHLRARMRASAPVHVRFAHSRHEVGKKVVDDIRLVALPDGVQVLAGRTEA